MCKLVTVIVPVYNVENYLETCVNSILQQTYEDLQVILVDDGSKDKSVELCDKYAKKDKRVQVVHKEHEGVSAARNAGIELVKGEYVLFSLPIV